MLQDCESVLSDNKTQYDLYKTSAKAFSKPYISAFISETQL